MYGRYSEPVCLSRDCDAIAVPEGVAITLPKATIGTLAQALGGSFTVYVQGKMFRIAGQDADALGKEPMVMPELPADASLEEVEKLVWEQMKSCFDPEIPVNIVDLGLVYECRVESRQDGSRAVYVKMTLTEPSCGMGQVIAEDVKSRIELIAAVSEAHVDLVFDPPWKPEMMSEVAKLETGLF